MTENEVFDQLKKLRSEQITRQSFATVVSKNVAAKFFPKMQVLQLYHGDLKPVFVENIPLCGVCSPLAGAIKSGEGFDSLSDDIFALSGSGQFKKIEPPGWYIGKSVMGGELFYRCLACESVWRLVCPERSQTGLCERVG